MRGSPTGAPIVTRKRLLAVGFVAGVNAVVLLSLLHVITPWIGLGMIIGIVACVILDWGS